MEIQGCQDNPSSMDPPRKCVSLMKIRLFPPSSRDVGTSTHARGAIPPVLPSAQAALSTTMMNLAMTKPGNFGSDAMNPANIWLNSSSFPSPSPLSPLVRSNLPMMNLSLATPTPPIPKFGQTMTQD